MYGQRLPKLLVVKAYEKGKEHLIDFLAHKVSRIEHFRGNVDQEFVAGKSLGQTLHLLQEKGLDREYLPRCLGESYDYNQYDEWIWTRLCVEDNMSAAPNFPNNLQIKFPTIPGLANANTKQTATTITTTITTTTTTTAGVLASTVPAGTSRKAFHARRARGEKKNEVSDLENQRRRLLQKNECLRVENRRLEGALAQVRYLAALHKNSGTTGTTPPATIVLGGRFERNEPQWKLKL